MDEILFKLLEQTPVIIALSLGIFALWKDKKETKIEMTKERTVARKEMREVKERHALALKELNQYIRERDLETLGALEEVTVAVSSIHTLINDKLRLLD
jgi:endo-1,4-beta-D-glucanase Y